MNFSQFVSNQGNQLIWEFIQEKKPYVFHGNKSKQG